MSYKISVLALCLATAVFGNPTGQDDLTRLEIRLESTMDELNHKDEITILKDFVTLKKVENRVEIEEGKNVDPLVAKIERFFGERELKISFPNDNSTADFFGRALGEKNVDIQLRSLTQGASEARTKLKRVILPLLLALKLKALVVLPILLTVLGLIGVKGLGTGVLALFLAGAVALKALVHHPHHHYPARVSYNIARPLDFHHDHHDHHDFHHDHWHRSQEEIDQPYKGYAPEYNDQYHYPENTAAFVP